VSLFPSGRSPVGARRAPPFFFFRGFAEYIKLFRNSPPTQARENISPPSPPLFSLSPPKAPARAVFPPIPADLFPPPYPGEMVTPSSLPGGGVRVAKPLRVFFFFPAQSAKSPFFSSAGLSRFNPRRSRSNYRPLFFPFFFPPRSSVAIFFFSFLSPQGKLVGAPLFPPLSHRIAQDSVPPKAV